MTSPQQAAARELGRLSVDDPLAVVVTGRDPGLAGGFLEGAQQRRIVAPAASTRLAVGAGAAMCRRPTLVLVDSATGVDEGPWDLGGALIAVTGSQPVAGAAQRAGARVLQPAWPTDVGPLLHAAIARGRPCCMLLHDVDVSERPADLDAPPLRGPRVLAEGAAGTVVVSGRLAPAVREAARGLARRGVATTVLELAMLPRDGFGPDDAESGVLVGNPEPAGRGASSARLEGRRDLRFAAVPSPEPRVVAEALLGALRPAGVAGDPAPGP